MSIFIEKKLDERITELEKQVQELQILDWKKLADTVPKETFMESEPECACCPIKPETNVHDKHFQLANAHDYANPRAVLCYVDGNEAYFTTQKLEDQWGDDWNDAPWDLNAGTPYRFRLIDNPKYIAGGEKAMMHNNDNPYKIYVVAFHNDWKTEQTDPWAVNTINSGEVPWLMKPFKAIWAGCTLEDFLKQVKYFSVAEFK